MTKKVGKYRKIVLDKIRGLLYNNSMKTVEDIKVHIPIEVRRLKALAHACRNANNDDFKAMWYHKLIDLAKEYKLMSYVMNRLVH